MKLLKIGNIYPGTQGFIVATQDIIANDTTDTVHVDNMELQVTLLNTLQVNILCFLIVYIYPNITN